MAEGLLRLHLQRAGLANQFEVDSAGTRTSLQGARPDQRAQKAALAAGVDIGRVRARRITARDYECNVYIFAMDLKNLADMEANCPLPFQHKLSLLLTADSTLGPAEIPDPYYGSPAGFSKVFDMIDQGVEQIIPLLDSHR